MSIKESLQFLLNYADIWVWEGLILLYGHSGSCCCRLVCFQLTSFCPIVTCFWTCCWQFFFFSLPSIWSCTMDLYIFILFHFFPCYDPFFLTSCLKMFFPSLQYCHKCLTYILVHFIATLSLSKAYQ